MSEVFILNKSLKNNKLILQIEKLEDIFETFSSRTNLCSKVIFLYKL